MIHDNAARDGNGRWNHSASRNGNRQGAKLARLMTRQFGHGPGTPGAWSRFLVAHSRWILAVTLVVVAAAAAFAFTRTPLYLSEADIVVNPAPGVGGATAQQPDMSTEANVVTSGIVLSMASRAAGVPAAELGQGLSVKARGSSYVLQIFYSNPAPSVAQRRAAAIAQAYTSFRSAKPTPKSGPQNTASTAMLITPASLPTSPYSPSYGLDIGVALLVGLALAIVTAWGRDRLDDRLRGPLDLERQADANVLALIPAFRPRDRRPSRRLAMTVSPSSMVAEAYRGLRTRVLLAAPARNSRTILVTSPAWEDRGTVAANLAAALAQSGRSTVLVCADLHWGRAHLLFGTWNDAQGLTELLEQRTTLTGALHPTSVPGLQLVPPGALPPDASALMQPPAFRTALNEILTQADVVVIEAPPLLVSPDARPLADSAEMILLIADARASTRAQVRAAVRELEHDRARFAGCVLVSVGSRRRLRPTSRDVPLSAQANDWSHREPLSNSNVSPTSGPDTALAEPGSKIGEEKEWPERS